ncbi:MAG: DUF4230 domain-containing protein [Solobacterium sp.]|nr:DUF4230 domain-containing protein [Solobacterium sp.]
MADTRMKVDSKAEVIETEKTSQQKKDADAIAKRKAQAEKEAETARKENEKKQKEAEEEKARQKKEEEERKAKEEAEAKQTAEQLSALSAAAAAAALKGTSKIRWSDFLKGCLIGLLCGALLCYFVLDRMYRNMMAEQNTHQSESVIDESPVTFTVADFEQAVLGAASEHSELIVMEQPLSINTTITKSGLGNLSIFSKMKDVTYYGTGVYTVDLSRIDTKHIFLDTFNKRVNILIPHAALQYVNPDLDRTEFQDTEKGWLAFGDIRLTAEESNELEKSVRSAMEERLNEDDLLIQADEFAVLKTWEIFQPLISAVSPEYTVEMEFED